VLRGGTSLAAGPAQVRALAEAAGGAPQLLPHYARVAATLAQVFPDVAPPLVRALEDEFASLQVHLSSLVPLVPAPRQAAAAGWAACAGE